MVGNVPLGMAYFQRLCQSRVSVIRVWFYAVGLFFWFDLLLKAIEEAMIHVPNSLVVCSLMSPENRQSGHASDQTSGCWFPVMYAACKDQSSHIPTSHTIATPQDLWNCNFLPMEVIDSLRNYSKPKQLETCGFEVDEGSRIVGAKLQTFKALWMEIHGRFLYCASLRSWLLGGGGSGGWGQEQYSTFGRDPVERGHVTRLPKKKRLKPVRSGG